MTLATWRGVNGRNIPTQFVKSTYKPIFFRVIRMVFVKMMRLSFLPIDLQWRGRKVDLTLGHRYQNSEIDIFIDTVMDINHLTFAQVGIFDPRSLQVRSSDQVNWHCLTKVYNRVQPAVFVTEDSNLVDYVTAWMPLTCISRIFHICNLRSGQCRDLSIMSQWRKNKMPLEPCVRLGAVQIFWNHVDLEKPR